MFGIVRSIILLGIAIAVFFLYTSPTYRKMSLLKNEGNTYEQALNSSNQFEKARDIINERYQSFSKSDIDKLKLLLPDTVDNVRLIIDIEKIAKDSGLVFKKVSYDAKESIKAKASTPQTVSNTNSQTPQAAQPVRLGVAPDDSKPYGVFNLNFTVQGPYDQFLKFLKALESSLRIVDVTSISFTSLDSDKDIKKNSTSVYEYTITAKTYWLKD